MLGFNFGLLGGSGGGLSSNMCWDVLTLIAGTTYGHDLGSAVDTITPSTTSDGTTIYSFTFDTATGVFVASFGNSGNEQLDNNSVIVFEYGGEKVALEWDDTESYYTGTDSAMATSLATQVGTLTCFLATVAPDLMISYDYVTVEVEE